jgi:multiple RNA-binding domain-containing protein 1
MNCLYEIEWDSDEFGLGMSVPYICHVIWQVARKIGDPDAPRPWSRHSLKKPEYGSKDKNNAGAVDALPKDSKAQGTSAHVSGSKGSVANDPKFLEFLEAMQPRSKAKMWANDTAATLDTAAKDSIVATKESKGPLKNVPASENDSSSEDASDEEMANDSSSENASEELQTENKQDKNMTDADFFKSKVKKNWSDSESDDEGSGDQSNTTTDDEESSDESQYADNQLADLKGNLDKKNIVDKDTLVENTNLQEMEDLDNKESEDLDGRRRETEIREDQEKEDENGASITDEKKLALETGRLYICNLPYATRYIAVAWSCYLGSAFCMLFLYIHDTAA